MAPDLAVYVHIPFCLSRCHYCDFDSGPYSPESAQKYIAALEKEAGYYRASWPSGQEVSSIYIGGGTPTCLSRQELERVLVMLLAFPRAHDLEWTVEANPGTLSRSKLRLLASAGVNRLSLGVQSFDDRILAFLGRIHNAHEARVGWGMAREAGFDNLSLDLIYAIPGQGLDSWRKTLADAVKLEPEHISTYSLMIEEGTEFYRRKLQTCSEDLDAAQYQLAQDLLQQAGLLQYEISNFARPGFRCRHNLVYWHNEPYLGLGLAATSYLDQERRTNVRDLSDYCKLVGQDRLPVGETERSAGGLERTETVILALRLCEGLSRQYFVRRFGCSIDLVYGEIIGRLVGAGLLMDTGDRIVLTERGLRLYNQVALAFL